MQHVDFLYQHLTNLLLFRFGTSQWFHLCIFYWNLVPSRWDVRRVNFRNSCNQRDDSLTQGSYLGWVQGCLTSLNECISSNYYLQSGLERHRWMTQSKYDGRHDSNYIFSHLHYCCNMIYFPLHHFLDFHRTVYLKIWRTTLFLLHYTY